MSSADEHPTRNLLNESRIRISALLQEPVGSSRAVHVHFDTFPLDDDLLAQDLDADVRLTRLQHHVLASGAMHADVELECVRCLTRFDQAVETSFSEPFRQTHDVRTGVDISDHRDLAGEVLEEDDEDAFVIDEGHELDLSEALRQNLVLALPMTPVCGDQCPGPPEHEHDDTPAEQEGQFDVLAELLENDNSRPDTQ